MSGKVSWAGGVGFGAGLAGVEGGVAGACSFCVGSDGVAGEGTGVGGAGASGEGAGAGGGAVGLGRDWGAGEGSGVGSGEGDGAAWGWVGVAPTVGAGSVVSNPPRDKILMVSISAVSGSSGSGRDRASGNGARNNTPCRPKDTTTVM